MVERFGERSFNVSIDIDGDNMEDGNATNGDGDIIENGNNDALVFPLVNNKSRSTFLHQPQQIM